jgi:hypothetical protein
MQRIMGWAAQQAALYGSVLRSVSPFNCLMCSSILQSFSVVSGWWQCLCWLSHGDICCAPCRASGKVLVQYRVSAIACLCD